MLHILEFNERENIFSYIYTNVVIHSYFLFFRLTLYFRVNKNQLYLFQIILKPLEIENITNNKYIQNV